MIICPRMPLNLTLALVTTGMLAAAGHPDRLEAQAIATDAIRVTWRDNAANEQGYVVQRSRERQVWSTIATLSADTTMYVDAGLMTRSLYFYRVHLAGNPTAASNWNYATTLQQVHGDGVFRFVRAFWRHDGGVSLTWTDDFGDVTGYRIERSDDGGSSFTVITQTSLPATARSFVDDALPANQEQAHYRVTAIGPGGTAVSQAARAALSYTADSPYGISRSHALTPPQSFHVAHRGTAAIDLAWQDPATAGDRTFLTISYDDGRTWSYLAHPALDSASYTFNAAMPNTAYRFAIASFDDAGNCSLPSPTVQAACAEPVTDLPAPSDLTATRDGSDILLHWQDNSGDETGFAIEYVSMPRIVPVANVGPDVTSYRLVGQPSGTWRVQARRGNDGSRYSNPVGMPYPSSSAPLPTPTDLVATARSHTRIDLAWDAYPTGFSYPDAIVERSTDGQQFEAIEYVRAAQSCQDWLCDPGTTYHYRIVIAKDQTLLSNVATVTTPANMAAPAAPAQFTADAVARSQVNLAWQDRANNESGYRIERLTGGAWSVLAELPANTERYSDTGLPTGSSWQYRVIAVGTTGATSSASASVTTLASDPAVTSRIVSRFSFDEMIISGTAANDAIRIDQSGDTILVFDHDVPVTLPGAAAEHILVRAGPGDDVVVVTANVQLPVTIYGDDGDDVLTAHGHGKNTLVAIGHGHDRLTGNGIDTSYWADGPETDAIVASPAEVDAGRVHQIRRFAQPRVMGEDASPFYDPRHAKYRNKVLEGGDWPDGFLFNSPFHIRLHDHALWGITPSLLDVNQGFHQNCPTTSFFQHLVDHNAGRVQELLVDLGDNTFAAHCTALAPGLYTRVDGHVVPGTAAELGPAATQWWLIAEKIYSWGLGLGHPVVVDEEWLISTVDDTETVFANIRDALARDAIIRCYSPTAPRGGVWTAANHSHSIHEAYRAANGTPMLILRNPYGVHYQYDFGPVDPAVGMMRLSVDQFRAIFTYPNCQRVRLPRPSAVLAGSLTPTMRQICIETITGKAVEPILDDDLLPSFSIGSLQYFPLVDAAQEHCIRWLTIPTAVQ